MDREIYRRMREVESRHWWFRGRRRILSHVLGSLQLPAGISILDVGCGTGGNLEMLSGLGRVTGMEMDAEARSVAAEKRLAPVLPGSLPSHVPFEEAAFDLVTMLDVLEHIDEDDPALAAVTRLLTPGGYLLLTVPAYAFLWSRHDEVHHHRRRYVLPGLRQQVERAGLTVRRATYFNTWLLPVVVAARLLQRLVHREPREELPLPAPWVNLLLEHVFASERLVLGRWNLPAGVSILLLAQKRPA